MKKFNEKTQQDLISTLNDPKRFIAIHDAIVDDLNELADVKKDDRHYEGTDLTLLVKPSREGKIIRFEISDKYKEFHDAEVLYARLILIIERNIRPDYLLRYQED